MLCKYCGKEIEDTAKFCKFCGEEQKNVNIENKNEELYDKDIEKYMENLQQKDGNKHVLLVNTFLNLFKDDEKEINIKINRLIGRMQNKQYEIIDMKLCSNAAGIYKMLIIYK